jgi:hypothetical protein
MPQVTWMVTELGLDPQGPLSPVLTLGRARVLRNTSALPVLSAVPEVLELGGTPAGWLVLTDSNYSGWTAKLDGAPVPIHFANGYQRAVRVEVGSQRLVFRYRAPGLALGALLSGLAVLIMTLWGVFRWIRRRFR